ncbi:MAG: isoprenylcysteine carboxylmethyltransferase family protein [Verrucomicrobiae bacterium]|nr:isoprenylcysteine carboxylmethyltransferase family protein [Verrucomicrobiae bacterium]
MTKEFSEKPPACDRNDLSFTGRKDDAIGPQGMALAGFIGFFGAWLLTWRLEIKGDWLPVLFFILTALPMVAISVFFNRTHRRLTAGLNESPGTIDWPRCGIKYLGFLGTVTALAFLYWLFPEYRRPYYQPFFDLAVRFLAPLLILALPYIVWVDRRMREPEDGYWQMGLFVLGRWGGVNWKLLGDHALAWGVKGFFLPIMIGGSVKHLVKLHACGLNFSSFEHFYKTGDNFVMSLDIIFATVGYIFTFRILDSHIRSAEPTVLGWAAALFCYLPFSRCLWPVLLTIHGSQGHNAWRYVMSWHPLVYISWGFAILVCHAFFAWATCSFGCRFSNLTNRGIVADGPYRYCKHPAYLAKNLAWWLMSVPFLAYGTWQQSLQATLLLGVTGLVYVLRAYTEERHLKKDPAYRVYCDWIDENGVWSQIKAALRRLGEWGSPPRRAAE